MLAKGHVQPHHDNVPRRHQRTKSPPDGSVRVKFKPLPVSPPDRRPRKALASPPRPLPIDDSTDWTGSSASSTTVEEDKGEQPSPRTPVTTPSDAGCLAVGAILDVDRPPYFTALDEQQSPDFLQEATCDNEPKSPFGILLPPGPPTTTLPALATSRAYALSNSAGQPRVSADGARGYLEPRATNVPRRLSRAAKDRERVRRRCLQEVIVGSRIWIAFDSALKCGGDDARNESRYSEELTAEERKERDWMWDSQAEPDFSGVVRVRIGKDHGQCLRRTRSAGKEQGAQGEREEMELIIGAEQARTHDDSGVSALSDSQLEAAASFLVDRRQKGGAGTNVLVTVPLSRPVEALSIALLALSLPSTSSISPHPDDHHSPSCLSQLRFLPGIIDLEQNQDIDIDDITESEHTPNSTSNTQAHEPPRYTLIQLALWHLHDMSGSIGYDDEISGGLKMEWRGVLSLDGIERLESLVPR